MADGGRATVRATGQASASTALAGKKRKSPVKGLGSYR